MPPTTPALRRKIGQRYRRCPINCPMYQDNVIASVSRGYSWTTGVQTATLEFDGMAISAHGANGPYRATGLSLLDAAGAMPAPDLHAALDGTAAPTGSRLASSGCARSPGSTRSCSFTHSARKGRRPAARGSDAKG